MLKKAAFAWMIPLILLGITSCDRPDNGSPNRSQYMGMPGNNQSNDRMQDRYKSEDGKHSEPYKERRKDGNYRNDDHYRKERRGCKTCKTNVYNYMDENCCRSCPPKKLYSCRPCKGMKNKPPREPSCRVCVPKDCPDRLECEPCK